MKAGAPVCCVTLRSCNATTGDGKLLTLLDVMELSLLKLFSNQSFFALASALMMAAMAATPAAALTAPKRQAVADASAVSIIKVRNKRHHRKHAHKHHRRHRIVEAPFARVDTGYGRRRGVQVDAPFAFVSVGRQGRYVRAPFVDLWVPRR